MELASASLRGCKFCCHDINEESLMFVSGTISGGDDATILLVAFYIGPTTLFALFT